MLGCGDLQNQMIYIQGNSISTSTESYIGSPAAQNHIVKCRSNQKDKSQQLARKLSICKIINHLCDMGLFTRLGPLHWMCVLEPPFISHSVMVSTLDMYMETWLNSWCLHQWLKKIQD